MRTDTEQRLNAIEARNAKVQLDKAWETSWTRRLVIVSLTYAVVLIWLIIIGNRQPYSNAAVPSAGYFISTLLLNNVRTVWQRRNGS